MKLSADGSSDTYGRINRILAPGGSAVEVPDCGHGEFGPHITQVQDPSLGKFVFRFHAHRDDDDDRCKKGDRQRTEIKVYDGSPDKLKGRSGDVFIYRWKFRMPEDFQPSRKFTHLHQIKTVGGSEANMPLVTLTARKGKGQGPDRFELRHGPSRSQYTAHWVPLTPLLGLWLSVIERIHYGEAGRLAVSITETETGAVLFNFSSRDIRMWKTGADFQRPKWGIYRSLSDKQNLKDETIDFADFEIEF